MNKEEATSILHEIEDRWLEPKTYLHERENKALDIAIEALRSPWIKTSDRLPTESNDTAGCGKVFVLIKRRYEPGYIVSMERVDYIIDHPEEFAYWMPVPPMPEVEE